MVNSSKKKFVIIGSVALVACILIVIVMFSRGNSDSNRVRDLFMAGNRYLSELDYEQAIVSYQAIIEIDPKCEEAYLALAEVYVAMEDYEAAVDILNQGVTQTSSEKLLEYLYEIEAAYKVRKEAEEMQRADVKREYLQISASELKSEIEELCDGYVYNSYYDDFDGDGINEMFALVLSNNIPVESMEEIEGAITCTDWSIVDHTAVLCFANEDGARMVSEVFSMYDTSLKMGEIIFGEEKCVLLERRAQVDYNRNLYAFYNGEVFENDITSLDAFGTMGLFEYRNDDGMLYVKSNYCLQADENYSEDYIRVISRATTYYTDWIPYIYYEGRIYEQELREISQEYFMRYNNAFDIWKAVQEQARVIVSNSEYNDSISINDYELYNILYDGNTNFYINYVCENPLLAWNAEVVLQEGELSLVGVEPGMCFKKVGFFPGFYKESNGKNQYIAQTEEEAYITQLLKESGLCIIDYCYDDFNADGNYEMLGILSHVQGTNGLYLEVPIEIWQVNEKGCIKTDIEMQESSIDTYYQGFEVLQFGANRQIEILVETIASAGDGFKGAVVGVDDNGNFHKLLEPLFPLKAINGETYFSSGTDIIDTPYYGTGYSASLYYPVYYINGVYYEMTSVEIEESRLNEIDNWSQIKVEIGDLLNGDYIWPNCWRIYSCANAEITEVFYNEIGKIYINYCGIETLQITADMGLNMYPNSYATVELTLKGNHIEAYELLAGIRKTNATDFEKKRSDISKIFQ